MVKKKVRSFTAVKINVSLAKAVNVGAVPHRETPPSPLPAVNVVGWYPVVNFVGQIPAVNVGSL